MSKTKIIFFIIVLLGLFGAFYFYGQSTYINIESIDDSEDTADEVSGVIDNALADHQIYYSTSPDGVDWTRSNEAIAKFASVPNLLQLDKAIGDFKAGTLITHFVDASEMTTFGEEFIAYLWSDDNGETWSDRERINIEGIGDDIVTVDPSVVQLEDGRLRIYYYDLLSYDPLGDNGTPSFYSAISEDGVNFEYEQKVFDFDGTGITDPEVIWFEDRWLLYFSVNVGNGRQIMHVAESEDGLNFKSIADIEFSGIPGALVVDGRVELYGCGTNISRVVSDDGINFDTDNIEYLDMIGGCDPDPVQLDDGSFALVTKEIDMDDENNSSSNAFISIHLEPNELEEISEIEKYLEELVLMANSRDIYLTLMFSDGWPQYLEENSVFLQKLEFWVENGNEVAIHHHTFSHADWDGYTNDTSKSKMASYQGDMNDFMSLFDDLPFDIVTGSMNDEDADWVSPLIYNTDGFGVTTDNKLLSIPTEKEYNGIPVIEVTKGGYATGKPVDNTLAEIEDAINDASKEEIIGINFSDDNLPDALDEIEKLFTLLAEMDVKVQTVRELLSQE